MSNSLKASVIEIGVGEGASISAAAFSLLRLAWLDASVGTHTGRRSNRQRNLSDLCKLEGQFCNPHEMKAANTRTFVCFVVV